MEELLDKIKSNIIEQIKVLEDEILKLNDSQSLEKEISNFISSYEKNDRIDINLLSTFFQNLNLSNLKTLDDYSNIQKLIDYYVEKNVYDNSIFRKDYISLKKEISNLLVEINRLREKLFSNIRSLGFKRRELERISKDLEYIEQIISNFEVSKFMSEENSDFIFAYLNENKIISDEDFANLFRYITIMNAKMLEEVIKLETIKLHKKQLKEHEEVTKNIISKSEKEIEEKLVSSEKSIGEQIVEVSIDLDKDVIDNSFSETEDVLYKEVEDLEDSFFISVFGEENAIKYFEMKDLVSKITDVDDKIDSVSKIIGKNASYEDRIAIYESLTLIEDRIKLVLYDLKVNYIPMMEYLFKIGVFDDEVINLFIKLFDYYVDLIEQQNKKDNEIISDNNLDYRSCLTNLGKTKELEICDSVDRFIEELLELIENDREKFNDLYQFVVELREKKNSYTDSVEVFCNENLDEYSELMDFYYLEMKEFYDELNNKYHIQLYSIKSNQDILLQSSKDFYDGASEIKNIIVFVNDDGDVIPVVERDILDERNFDTNTYADILKRLQENVSEDLYAKGHHKVKNDRFYSEEFLKKYHVKSIDNGVSRTFYSVFNTNLGELYDKGPIKVMYVYLIGYGKVSGGKKVDINYQALKRCKDDCENIDYYLELLNTKWSELSFEELEIKKKEVDEFLNRQNIKLGHLVTILNSKIDRKEQVRD